MKDRIKELKKTHVNQRYQSDCGVACLLSVIQYYGGNGSLERLRELSGTTIQGTSLLGLYQTATESGFDAKGIRGEISQLKNFDQPLILHFMYDTGLEHYVTYYGYDAEKGYLIGDPANEVKYMLEPELDKHWSKRYCLLLSPNSNFISSKKLANDKIKLFISLLEEDYKLILSTVLIGVCIAVLGLAKSVFSQKLIDVILPSHDNHKLIVGIFLLFLLLTFRIGFIVLRELITLNQTRNFNCRINGHFFSNIIELPKLFFDNRKTGELVARLNDTHRIQDVIKTLISNTILDLIICLVSLVVLFLYSWEVALLAFASLPIYFYLIYRNRNRIIASQQAIMQSYATNESNYISTIQGISTIKNDNKQDWFNSTNINVFKTFQEQIFNLGKINLNMSWQAGFSGVLFLILILSYTSFAVLNNQLKTGELMAIIGISGSLIPSIGNLALIFIPVNEAKVAFSRMYDVVSIDKESKNGNTIDSLDRIELIDVNYRFPGCSPLFQHISFKLEKTTVTSLIGESGSGKTTLANILQRLYMFADGQIIINNLVDIQSISIRNWRDKIGVVPQAVHIFNGNVVYNIVLQNDYDTKLLQGIVEKYGLVDFINGLPNGLMTLVGEEGINLSGGQKQMIGLLRVLYRQPEFYIFDEPTASLDKNNENLVLDIIQKIKETSIVLIISHKMSFLEACTDKIYELKSGCIEKVK